ncbi:precorrin-6y C5,15-methyltransferase (decarboxylating) subunit CbiE [Helicovermis profundi]|uniref:Precorrin-6y C5,15-methyltransferase (Decarboxylating) subunit CbiE n=1 Tax=Helicovermis profundi TaxID=3065157 RepID=A0AAU9E483_9FIRM|nr:precorrin-6y C5,15-methyltransferase (decarboxylating) subunit CbiE [Clostridia bacterium S502]
MNKFNIVGIGPGNPKYILPIATEIIENSDILIGGRRNLDSLKYLKKEEFIITGDLTKTIEFISANYQRKRISVILSGDTGFYSMLNFLSKHFDKSSFNVTAGISSLQYMYSKLALTYHNGILTSVHGRQNDFLNLINEKETLGLLTDKKNNPSFIAKEMKENLIDIGQFEIYVGENLSYENEKITVYAVDELAKEKCEFSDLNVVIIINKNELEKK